MQSRYSLVKQQMNMTTGEATAIFCTFYFLDLEVRRGDPLCLLVRYNRKQDSERIIGLILFQLGLGDWLLDSCALNC